MNRAHSEVINKDTGRILRLDQGQSLAQQSLDRTLELIKNCFLRGDDLTHEIQFPVVLLRFWLLNVLVWPTKFFAWLGALTSYDLRHDVLNAQWFSGARLRWSWHQGHGVALLEKLVWNHELVLQVLWVLCLSLFVH